MSPVAAPPGPILATRDELVTILEGAGIVAIPVVSGRFVAPVAIVEPGDPFVSPVNLGAGWRRVRWRVWIISGTADSGAALASTAELAQRIVVALDRAPGWTAPTVSGPRLVRVVGVEGGYTAAELAAETVADITEG